MTSASGARHGCRYKSQHCKPSKPRKMFKFDSTKFQWKISPRVHRSAYRRKCRVTNSAAVDFAACHLCWAQWIGKPRFFFKPKLNFSASPKATSRLCRLRERRRQEAIASIATHQQRFHSAASGNLQGSCYSSSEFQEKNIYLQGDLPVVECLLKEGADPSLAGGHLLPPLHLAAMTGSHQIVNVKEIMTHPKRPYTLSDTTRQRCFSACQRLCEVHCPSLCHLLCPWASRQSSVEPRRRRELGRRSQRPTLASGRWKRTDDDHSSTSWSRGRPDSCRRRRQRRPPLCRQSRSPCRHPIIAKKGKGSSRGKRLDNNYYN